jgi:hypothetical protein
MVWFKIAELDTPSARLAALSRDLDTPSARLAALSRDLDTPNAVLKRLCAIPRGTTG